MQLLKELIQIPGASSDESRIKSFLLDHIQTHQQNWKVQPTILSEAPFQDNLILVFGKPTTAIYAHIDTIGFSTGYDHELIRIGGPDCEDGTILIGHDSQGTIETEMMQVDQETGYHGFQYVFPREIDRGTILTYQPNFRETENYIQSPYLDNRLGVWNALKVAETLENGVIVFSTYEEHGGNSVEFIANYLFNHYQITQSLISDITWVTDGVQHGKGVAISLRDQYLPRKSYLNKIVELTEKSGIDFQLEVESAGGSDGSTLQKSGLPIDWCFIGAPENNVHSPHEKVHKYDIQCMVDLYQYLMKHL